MLKVVYGKLGLGMTYGAKETPPVRGAGPGPFDDLEGSGVFLGPKGCAWQEFVCETWSRRWSQAVAAGDRDTWLLLSADLLEVAQDLDCGTHRELAVMAFDHAEALR